MKSLHRIYIELIDAMRVGWFLAFRQIKRTSKGTTTLIIFIMVLTFLNLVVVSGLLLGLISGSFIQYKASYSGDVIVTPATGHDFIDDSRNLIKYLAQNQDVVAFSARYRIGAQILGTLDELPKKNEQANEASVALSGINPDTEETVTNFSRFVIHGEPLLAGDDNYILVGANIIQKYSSFADADIPGLNFLKDVDVGSKVRVTIPQKDGTVASKDYIIKGIVKSKIDEISTRAFVLDSEIRQLLTVNNLEMQEIAIRTTPGKDQHIVDDIKAFLGESHARVQTSEQAIPTFLRDIETTMAVLGNALSSIALVVATITIFIVIYINAVTKRKFIGIMKGVGISPWAIQFSYVLQALFYGISGAALGWVVTFGLLEPYFEANPIDFPFSDGILVVTAASAGLRVAILIIVTLIAGYIPAKLIVRKNTLDAILGR